MSKVEYQNHSGVYLILWKQNTSVTEQNSPIVPI